MASKRPATTDLAEASDKKSKSMDPAPSPASSADTSISSADISAPMKQASFAATDVSNIPRRAADSGILSLLTRSIAAPYPVHDTHEVVVTTLNYSQYFKHLRADILNVVYPDTISEVGDIITEAQFVLVCRYLMKSRVDSVYSSVSGRRPVQRIAIPRDFELPKALADLINGIGVITVLGGAIVVLPHPEAIPQDPNQSLDRLVSFAMLTSFARLITAAKRRGFINTAYLSSSSPGTAWWLLTVRSISNTATVASDTNNVTVYSAFREFTPTDALFAAIVQNLFDGQIADVQPNKWSTESIRGVSSIRSAFDIGA